MSPGQDTVDQGHSPTPTYITVTVIIIHTDAVPGHIIETIDLTIGVLHNALTPLFIIPTMTPHITDHPCTGAHQLTLRTTADHVPSQHTSQVKNHA